MAARWDPKGRSFAKSDCTLNHDYLFQAAGGGGGGIGELLPDMSETNRNWSEASTEANTARYTRDAMQDEPSSAGERHSRRHPRGHAGHTRRHHAPD